MSVVCNERFTVCCVLGGSRHYGQEVSERERRIMLVQRLRSRGQRAWEEDYVGTAKNGFGAQRLWLLKQCVALNVPNSPKFARAMISQHMYYINNPLFYISPRLVIHVHKRCNARHVLQNNQQCAIQPEWCNRYRLHVLHHISCITSHYDYIT